MGRERVRGLAGHRLQVSDSPAVLGNEQMLLPVSRWEQQ